MRIRSKLGMVLIGIIALAIMGFLVVLVWPYSPEIGVTSDLTTVSILPKNISSIRFDGQVHYAVVYGREGPTYRLAGNLAKDNFGFLLDQFGIAGNDIMCLDIPSNYDRRMDCVLDPKVFGFQCSGEHFAYVGCPPKDRSNCYEIHFCSKCNRIVMYVYPYMK